MPADNIPTTNQPQTTQGAQPSLVPPPFVGMVPPGQPTTSPPQAPQVAQGAPLPQDKKEGPVKKKPLVLIVILFLLIVVGIVAFFSTRTTGDKKVSEKTTIVWWGLWEDEATVSSVIDKYEASNPNVEIKYVKQSKQDYRERLTNLLAKKEGPDIFRFHNTWVPMFEGQLAPLPSTVISPADYVQTFYPVAVSDLSNSTGTVGIPLEVDGLGLYINEAIFAESGKVPPTTWDELKEVAKELTITDENGLIIQSGVSIGRTENVDHWPEILALMMLQNGADLNNPTGVAAQNALSFFTSFSSEGIWDETLPFSTTAFSGGKVAMYIGPSWRAFEITKLNPDLRFKVIPTPQLPGEDVFSKDIAYASYWAEGVWSGSKSVEESWKFLRYLSSQESLISLFDSAAKYRAFGEPYPRTDMAALLLSHPLAGAFIEQAKNYQSWYLASNTFDGPTGINSQMNSYFKDAINYVNDNGDPADALVTVAQGVKQVLQQFEK